MRKIIDKDEELFFIKFITNDLNEQLNKYTELIGYDRFIEVTEDMLSESIKKYESN